MPDGTNIGGFLAIPPLKGARGMLKSDSIQKIFKHLIKLMLTDYIHLLSVNLGLTDYWDIRVIGYRCIELFYLHINAGYRSPRQPDTTSYQLQSFTINYWEDTAFTCIKKPAVNFYTPPAANVIVDELIAIRFLLPHHFPVPVYSLHFPSQHFPFVPPLRLPPLLLCLFSPEDFHHL